MIDIGRESFYLVVRDMPVLPPWLPGMRPYQAGDSVTVYEVTEE